MDTQKHRLSYYYETIFTNIPGDLKFTDELEHPLQAQIQAETHTLECFRF